MQLNFQKQILPHLIGVGVFYLLIVFYFSPLVFDGKVIFQSDILQWEGSAKEVLDYRAETGEQALWTNSMFGGMPAYFISLEFPGDITNALVSVLTLGLPHPINGLFFGMLGMYVLLLSFRVRPIFAIAGAIAFSFNTYNLLSLEAGHNAKIWAVCLIPLILAGIHLAFEKKHILGAALLAVGLLLQLKFNHLQITYYTLIVSVIYVLVRLAFDWKKEGIAPIAKAIGYLAIGAILAVGGNLGRLATALEYSPYSTRGKATLETESAGLDKDYAFNWSNGKLETLTLLVPDFYGGGSQTPLPKNSEAEKALRSNGVDPAQINGFIKSAPTYWGDQPFTGGPIYGGVILIFLAILGFWAAPKESLIAFGVIIIFSLMLSWGKNLAWFNYLLFDVLPGYNKFRAVSMALGMTLFAIPVLGMISLERLVQKGDLKPLYLSGAIVGGLVLLLAVASGAFFRFEGAVDSSLPDWLASALQKDRKAMLSASAWKSFGLIAAAFALVYFRIKGKISDMILGAALILLVSIDLWSINRRYLNEESFQGNPSRQFFAETPAEKEITADPGYFRVLSLTESLTQGARTSYRLYSLGGYHGAKLRRYQDLIDYQLQDEIQAFVGKAQEGNFAWESIGVINMLNTKYLIAGQEANAVFQNPEANGPAWVPLQVSSVKSNEEEIKEIGEIDTKTQATLNTSEFGSVGAGVGQVTLTSQSPNELRYQAEMDQGGLIVFSEIYYPEGWTATIDGKETPILRTNYLLRGLDVPQGSHEIVFTFAPSSYLSTKTPMIIFQYLILAALIGGVVMTFKEKNGRS
ncbi:membrane protein YfhO [Algoriphagus ornithinivorans]|uniref:Membrane protein YfhO n=1 Tax=Algoriphagus ornithinivorans TaxID=226506 RepID=A0A1I5JVR0_9BACT|nr:YfhO family protein [Algoriphagus ornithinivorans]SFO76481.1 membrane protein YfhO [Algoriphagus ornithinivorans]